ncbi:beta-ketoacyl synthase N-terminal-like domain-containing protein [Solwaraspora sp. WMMD1047]|uniref:beta-ketoacyl synthase N-terminal-like domain-containing protein n=1 Tax=Solwaraspora sp. WMMD1047 TaxID=3016102 RepID=UPI0024160AFD|nr:beta-ketoacyl synthase N-terminal-like domain-containing protein [Solwaraspora sp. WMMD1047]MDG4831691.1 beta-ketoacyl synthase N-terminal-like domain-containing protein [Solwaraspora sp. WMMD1047]
MTRPGNGARTINGPCVVGWSVVSPLGMGRESFVAGWRSGRTGQYPPDGAAATVGYPLADFDPTRLIGTKGTRTLDRMTLMVIATTAMVLAEHGPAAGDERNQVGLVLGTSTGSLASITNFLRDTFVQDKPFHVDPAAFPNTVMNGAAGRTAIWHGLRGPNSTVSGGHVTGLSALRYASRMIRRGYADTLLVGAVEELSEPVAWAAAQLRGDAAGRDPAEFTPMGEGCVAFLLDDATAAERSGRRPLAELVDFEFGVTDVDRDRRAQSRRLAAAIETLLTRTGTDPVDLWLVSLAGSGDGGLDEAERSAVDQVLVGSDRPRRVAVSGQVGNTFSALGAFQLAAVLAEAQRAGGEPLGRPALITSLGVDGAVACALVRV